MGRRVLFCTLNYFPAPTGGAEHQAQLQAEELVRRGDSVTVVCPRWPGTTGGRINGVRVRRLPSITRRPFRHVSYLVCLSVYLLACVRRFDIVHVHLANLQADVAALIARLFRRPVYVKVAAGGRYGDVQRMQKVAWLTRHYGLRHAARVQVLSDEIAAELRGIGVRPRRVVRIANGLSLEKFSPDPVESKAALRRRLGLPEDGVIVLFVGRISTQKGVHDLLHIWQSRIPPATLVLVGSRHTVGALSELPRVDNVIHHDFTANIVEYYHAADIFTLPSYAEGMSNALLEAMACGLPSVVSRIGAADTMIRHGENGFLFERGDRAALERFLMQLMCDRALQQRCGEAAAATIRDQFSVQSIVDRISAEYAAIGRPA